MAKKTNVYEKSSTSKKKLSASKMKSNTSKKTAVGPKTFGVPASTLVKTVQLLEREGALDEFILRSKGMSVDLSPLLKFLNRKGVGVAKSGTIHLGAVAAAARMVHAQFSEEFAADAASTENVRVSPRVVLYAKKFIAEKQIDRRNEFAAAIASPGEPCPGPNPYQCPHA